MLDMATAQQSNWMQKTNLRRVHVSDNDDSSFCLFNHQHNDGQLKDSPLRHSSFILISKAEVPWESQPDKPTPACLRTVAGQVS